MLSRKKESPRVRCSLYPSPCVPSNLRATAHFLPPRALAFACRRCAFAMSHPPLPAAAMAPKTSRGKGVAKDAGEKEPPESGLAVRRTQHAYFPSTFDAVHLRDYFKPLWGREMTGHPATHIVPTDFAKASPNRYPLFVGYFCCGLGPLF